MKKCNKIILKTLSLRNIATFENQEIEFSNNFNAIVGETGSGKSLILDALQLVFGQRADKKLIRKGSDFAIVEATFYASGSEIISYFENIGHPFENNEILVKRIIYATGSSKTFLNYQSCSLQMLSTMSKRYIDLVGQFENQKLLSEKYQLALLDSYTNISEKVKSFGDSYLELIELKSKLSRLIQDSVEKKQREDYLRFQIDEISSLSPSPDDEENLIKKKELLIAQEAEKETKSKIISILSDSESSNITGQLKKVISLYESLLENNEKSNNLEKLYHAQNIIDEVSFQCSTSFTMEQNESLDIIIERLDKYQTLKRKFGATTEELIQKQINFNNEIEQLSIIELSINDTENKIKEIENKLYTTAATLHSSRVCFATKLSSELTVSIRSLRMFNAAINISLEKSENLTATGISKLKFNVETNLGEGFHKMKDVASGGELSRILLSIRQIISNNDSISVFLFDEIDTGVGGETALAIGNSLKNVSCNSQVIAITHLPQIAKYADKLIHVTKQFTSSSNEKQQRTKSTIKEVTGEKMHKYLMSMNPL